MEKASKATWKKHRNMEKAPQHGKSTATWKKHRNTSKHRKNNAAQEARQCKEKTKDQRQKTRLGPGPKPRPTQTEHKTKTSTKKTKTKRNSKADTQILTGKKRAPPQRSADPVPTRPVLDCNTRQEIKKIKKENCKKRQENTSYLRGRDPRRQTRRRDNNPLHSRRKN